jgi:hypothetical protein
MVLKGLAALLALSTFFAAQAAQNRPDYKPADAALQELVREALADRFVNRDIPDMGLLKDAKSVLVLREMYEAGLTLGPEALPDVPGVSFSLIATEDARERANKTKQNVGYIAVDRPAIAGTTATVWLGGDFEMPSNPNVLKMCCCAGEAHFEKRDGKWRFVKWGAGRCA